MSDEQKPETGEEGTNGAHPASPEEKERLRLLAKREAFQTLADHATAAGAWNGRQVATILQDRIRIAEDAAGLPAVRYASPDGTPLLNQSGEPIRDPRALVELALTDPANLNLLTREAAERRKRQNDLEREHLSRVPETQADFFKIPQELRQEALDAMTPAQRRKLSGLDKRKPDESEGYL